MEAAGIKVTMTTPIIRPATGTRAARRPCTSATRGFILEFENGFRVYAAGDTDVYGDMRFIRELYAPSWRCSRSAATTRWGRAARRSPPSSRVEHIIPIHYGTFPILDRDPDQLRSELAAQGPPGCRSTRPSRAARWAKGGQSASAARCRRRVAAGGAAEEQDPPVARVVDEGRAGAGRRPGAIRTSASKASVVPSTR